MIGHSLGRIGVLCNMAQAFAAGHTIMHLTGRVLEILNIALGFSFVRTPSICHVAPWLSDPGLARGHACVTCAGMIARRCGGTREAARKRVSATHGVPT